MANERKTAGKDGEVKSLLASFQIPQSAHYHQLGEKSFLVSVRQMSKRQKVPCRRVSCARHVCWSLCARRQMRSNCHNWPIIAEWGIENNAYISIYANSFSTRSWSLYQANQGAAIVCFEVWRSFEQMRYIITLLKYTSNIRHFWVNMELASWQSMEFNP